MSVDMDSIVISSVNASSSELPLETPANADDTQDYMILEEGNSSEAEEETKSIKETSEGIMKRVPHLNGTL